MKRVLVIGVSGSGKSTLAEQLARRTGLPYVATDPFYWEANWQVAPKEHVRQCVEAATSAQAWVLDGNFDGERALVWSRADTLVWLDYPFALTLARVILRNTRLLLSQKPTWSGNHMTLAKLCSGMRHTWRAYHIKRPKYPGYIAEFPHLQVFTFHAPGAASRWLESL
jgi:adenylate kinase family enzyme